MNEFMKFIDDLAHRFPLHVEIYFSKVMDWCVTVYRKGCAEDYPGTPVRYYDCEKTNDACLCDVQDSDMELAFAKAHVAVKEWMLKYNGGY